MNVVELGVYRKLCWYKQANKIFDIQTKLLTIVLVKMNTSTNLFNWRVHLEFWKQISKVDGHLVRSIFTKDRSISCKPSNEKLSDRQIKWLRLFLMNKTRILLGGSSLMSTSNDFMMQQFPYSESIFMNGRDFCWFKLILSLFPLLKW